MTRNAQRHQFLALALLLLNVSALVAQDSVDGSARDTNVVRLAPDKNLNGSLARVITAYRKDHPDASEQSLEVVIDHFFFHSKGMLPYVRQVTPLDDEGKPHGVQTRYVHNHREPVAAVPFSHGVRHGLEREWRTNVLVREVPWNNGVVHGVRKVYHRNGQLMAETPYQNGKEVGISKAYDLDGRLERLAVYDAGVRHGVSKDLWPETGEPRRVIPYTRGKVHGAVREYYQSGQLRREMSFDHDKLEGIERQYDPEGKLTDVRYWVGGKPVSKEQFERQAGS